MSNDDEQKGIQCVQCPLARSNNNGNSKTLSGGISGLLGILAIIAGVYAMVQPMRQSIEEIKTNVQTQFEATNKTADLQTERNHARFSKLEEWQKWWYRSIGMKQEHNYPEDIKVPMHND